MFLLNNIGPTLPVVEYTFWKKKKNQWTNTFGKVGKTHPHVLDITTRIKNLRKIRNHAAEQTLGFNPVFSNWPYDPSYTGLAIFFWTSVSKNTLWETWDHRKGPSALSWYSKFRTIWTLPSKLYFSQCTIIPNVNSFVVKQSSAWNPRTSLYPNTSMCINLIPLFFRHTLIADLLLGSER